MLFHTPRASLGVRLGSSRSSSRCAMRCCLRSSVRRLASVECGPNTGSMRQAAEQLEHLGQGQALLLERRDGVLDPAGLRPLAVLDEVLAPAADAMDLLGDVDRLEPGGERAHQVARQGGRAPLHRAASSSRAAGSPLRPRMAATRSASTSSNSASPPCSCRISPTSAPSACTSSRSGSCLGGKWMSLRFKRSRPPGVGLGGEVGALHAAPRRSAGRWGLHDHPVVPPRRSACAPSCSQAPHLGVDIVGLDVEVHTARVPHLLHLHVQARPGRCAAAVPRLLGSAADSVSSPSAAPQKRAAASRSSVWQSMMNPPRRLLCMGHSRLAGWLAGVRGAPFYRRPGGAPQPASSTDSACSSSSGWP